MRAQLKAWIGLPRQLIRHTAGRHDGWTAIEISAKPLKTTIFGVNAMNKAPGLAPETKKRLTLFAGRLRAARKARGWTQERLATVAGLGVSTVRAVEHGEPTPAMGSYLAILWALDLDSAVDLLVPPDLSNGGSGSPSIDTNF